MEASKNTERVQVSQAGPSSIPGRDYEIRVQTERNLERHRKRWIDAEKMLEAIVSKEGKGVADGFRALRETLDFERSQRFSAEAQVKDLLAALYKMSGEKIELQRRIRGDSYIDEDGVEHPAVKVSNPD